MIDKTHKFMYVHQDFIVVAQMEYNLSKKEKQTYLKNFQKIKSKKISKMTKNIKSNKYKKKLNFSYVIFLFV